MTKTDPAGTRRGWTGTEGGGAAFVPSIVPRVTGPVNCLCGLAAGARRTLGA